MIACARVLGALGWIALAALLSPSARAQDVTDAHDAEGRALFEAGRIAYAEGRYADAYDRFSAAYMQSERPDLLYNMAASADRLRRDEVALEHYRAFLAARPDSEYADEVRHRIAAIEAALSAEAAPDHTSEPVVSPDTPAAPAPTIDRGVDAGGVALAVTGGAVALAGAALIILAAVDQSTVENAPDGVRWEMLRDAYDRGPIEQVVGWTALGVGAAVAVVGVALAVSSGRQSAEVVLLPSGGAALRGSF